MKKLFKDWKIWEFVFLATCWVVILSIFFLSKEKSVLSLITSLLGTTSVFIWAKGLFFAPFLDIAYNVLYATISIITCYYGEAIIYIFIMMPISICSIVSWIKNKKEDSLLVKVNNVNRKEWLYLILSAVVLTFGFYFLLKALNTSQLIVSTISLISSVIGAYLLLRRSSYYAIAFIFNDIILIVLWALSIGSFGLAYLPNVLSFTIFLFNDTYGFIRWKKEEKAAKTLETNKEKEEGKL